MEELTESTVIRAGQRPPMMLFVPLNVFLVELFVFLFLFRFLGFYFVIFLPIHIYFVVKTEADVHWPRVWKANFKFWFSVKNKGLKGDDVVTFCPAEIKAGKNNYADFQ